MKAALPSPTELGFPEKFADWYPEQIEAIDRTVFNEKRFTALAMPTGSGKSVTGIATALLHPQVKRALYLTSTKGLEDQLSADFSSIGLLDIRGARNYPCRAVEPGEHLDRYRRARRYVGCDDGPCHSGVRCDYAPVRGEQHRRPACAYYGAVWDARHAELVCSNYSMYLSSSEYAEGFGPIDLLILDEAHDADKELESFLAIDIPLEDARYLGTKLLKDTDLNVWCRWADHHRSVLRVKVEQRSAQPPADQDGVRDLSRMKRILNTLNRLATVNPLDWIADVDPSRARFAPMRVAAYAEQYLFRKIPHVLLMSATMTPKTLQLLGIKREDAVYWECPSRFAVEHRPIISIHTFPPVRVDARMHETTKYLWLQRIERILEPRLALNWNGIIHTVSYQRMKELVALSDFRDRFLVHDSTNTLEVVREFKRRPNEGLVLVSPSVVTGYDFPDDQCRFQIIGKVPMPDMRGPINKVRAEIDKEYAGYLAMQKLVQACGRGVRGVNDWCETMIVDDHFEDWFLRRYWKHAPKWFKDAVYYLEHIPAPLELVS